jgi:hypothetical protein
MNLTAILNADVFTTAYQRQQCRNRLAELRVARSRASEKLLRMCCDVQQNPAALDPVRMSSAVAEIRYLDEKKEQLEKFLVLADAPEPGSDGDT